MPVYPSTPSLYPAPSGVYPGSTLPGASKPTFKVEIGWSTQIAGVITFGFSDFQTPVKFSVTNKALTSNVATLTAPGHNIAAGNTISVAGVDATFNTTGVVVTSVTSTTISYAKTAADVASAPVSGGTVGVVRTSDVFSNAFTNFFTGAYDDVTNDVESIRIRRGRDDILSQINAGTAELEMRRPTDRSYWNPANKSSALNASNTPGFVPMRPIRITATDPVTGVSTGLFWGFIRSARFNYETGVCRISCVDLFIALQRLAPLDPAFSTTQGSSTALADTFTPDAGADASISSATVTSRSRTGFVRTAI